MHAMNSGTEAPPNDEENNGRAACSTMLGKASQNKTRDSEVTSIGEEEDEFEDDVGDFEGDVGTLSVGGNGEHRLSMCPTLLGSESGWRKNEGDSGFNSRARSSSSCNDKEGKRAAAF